MFPGTFDESPAEETPPPPRRRIVLWLVVAGLGIVLVALYVTFTVIDSENQRIQSEISTFQTGLAATAPSNPTEDALEAELLILRRQIRAIETLHPTLVQGHLNWPGILSSLGAYDPNQIALTSLNQFENRLTINGRASDEGMVLAYSQSLEESGLFGRVVVQSMRVVTPPTPTPTPTATPTRASDATNAAAYIPAANGNPGLPLSTAKYVEFILLVELKVQQP